MKYEECQHEKSERHRSDNDDRIRATQFCVPCDTFWVGLFAKRHGEVVPSDVPLGVWLWGDGLPIPKDPA